VLIFFGLMAFIMSITRFYEQAYAQFFVDILLMIVTLVGYIKLKHNEKNFYTIFRVVLFFGFLAALSLVILISQSPMRFIWFTTVVYIMFYMLGKREGWLWAAVIALILISIFSYDSTIFGLNKKEFFTWIFNMFIILVVVNWYEKIKEEAIAKQKDTQALLEQEVARKTSQLQEINNNLEERINQEVEKNRNREQIMLHQTRLAQMGEMLSMIAHQWRQPLAAISATSSTIELKANRNKLDNNDIQKKAHAISHYSQHLSKTIDDFRNFFKPNKEKTETTYDEIISSVLGIMETSLKNKNIHLIKNLNCHDTFSTYPSEIKQVILNLITNAEEALLETMVEEPYIKIVTYIEEDQYILEVSDNAGGISAKNIEYIFDPYFSTKEGKDGTGLGLYMSKTIIEEHCGGILSVSNDENGAVFKIYLKRSV
jgi:signal transduction histidine kinase